MHLSFQDNLEISRIQAMGGKIAFFWCRYLVAAYLAFDTRISVNQNHTISLTDGDVLANLVQKNLIIVAVLTVHFLLSIISGLMHS